MVLLDIELEDWSKVTRALYMPVSQSSKVPRTSKERSLKWVRGVDDGTRDIILYLLNSNAIAILVSDGYIHLYRNGY